MKLRPVRICDVSRTLRISSASLIDFLRSKGYTIIGDYLSPLSSRMVELIQTGYQEGPPFQELTPMLSQAESWEKDNADLVSTLHTPPPPPVEKLGLPVREYHPRQKRAPKFRFIPPTTPAPTGRITLTPLDLELFHQALELPESQKIRLRDYLRRVTILKAISQLEGL